MESKEKIKNIFRELKAYPKAFELSMKIFEISKSFPKEELYNLTDQIRRSSRAICATIGEGYRKRQYIKYFVSKLSDADMENTETQIWLDFCLHCQYIDAPTYNELILQSEEIGKIISYMIHNPEKFQVNNKRLLPTSATAY
jgi:four helix bundle protein